MLALGILILRLVIGLTMAAHGAQKLFGWWGGPGMNGWTGAMNRMRIRPAVPWAWMSALAELLGGIGLAVGLLTPLPSLAIAGSMLAAIAAIALAGPGAYSLDSAFGIHAPEPVTLIVGTILVVAGVGVALGTRGPQPAAETKPQVT